MIGDSPFRRGDSPFPDLPYVITTDYRAALASALAKCPRRGDLPVEMQLALLEEDRAHELRERPKREAARQAPIQRGDLVDTPLDAWRDRLYEWQVRKLRARL